jgi:hypothetical protein
MPQQAVNELRIRISKPLLTTLFAMVAQTQVMNAETDAEAVKLAEAYAAQLLEASIAEFRLKQLSKKTLVRPCIQKGELISPLPTDLHRRKLDAVMTQKILFVRDSEGLNSRELAERFGVTHTTIDKILVANGRAVHTHPSTGHNGRVRGKNLVGPLSNPAQRQEQEP